VAPGSLIAGQSPSSVGSGDFSLNTAGRTVSELTAGDSLEINPTSSADNSLYYLTCGTVAGGAGQSVTYTLTGSDSGYSLSNITVYGGWKDAGRDQQAYTIYYSQVAAPTNFILLGSVNYNPANAANLPSATRATLSPATGWLATNVVAVKFDFTSPHSENEYCGYAEIAVYGLPGSPQLTMNTLPVTAADVVGSQVTFTAAFTAASPLAYQWQKIIEAITNNIAGATNPTLTLTNLQLSDTASYQLRATNGHGVAVSSRSSLAVSSVPVPVNNVITACAAQTGFGGSANDFYTTWTVAPGSLIAGMSPSSVGAGDFSEPAYHQCGTVTVLTDNSFGFLRNLPGNGDSPTEVACGTVAGGAGQSVTYTLAVSANGYNLTNITVYGGWGDAGRDQQAYTIYYSKKTAPATFIQLSSVNYNPANASSVQSATRATLTAVDGVLATNVAAVKFDFTTPAGKNGYEGYSEIDLYGVPMVMTNATNIVVQAAGSNLTLRWPSDHTGWRLQVQTNDVTQGLGTNWVDVANSTVTNQMTIPINPANGSIFYRMIYP